jgi:hypothetical protein
MKSIALKSLKKNEGMAEIASALLRQVEAEALAGGITSIALDTWAANGSARSFFEARGFTPFNLTLGKRLT